MTIKSYYIGLQNVQKYTNTHKYYYRSNVIMYRFTTNSRVLYIILIFFCRNILYISSYTIMVYHSYTHHKRNRPNIRARVSAGVCLCVRAHAKYSFLPVIQPWKKYVFSPGTWKTDRWKFVAFTYFVCLFSNYAFQISLSTTTTI